MRFCFVLLCLHVTTLAAAPRVVTSIAPVYEITAAIMADVADPGLIVDDPAATHHFAFKPSHMRRLQQADLVIWIDRHFEAGFSRVPDFLRPTTHQLELIPALKLDNQDGHIWYSSELLIKSTKIIRDTLVSLDPQNEGKYQANAATLMQAIADWKRSMRQQWGNRQPRYITDHNFTHYFEQDTGLGPVATVHDQHDDHGSLGDLHDLEHQLKHSHARCLLTQHAHLSPLAETLVQQYDLKILSLANEPFTDPDQPLILRRLEQLTTALQKCV